MGIRLRGLVTGRKLLLVRGGNGEVRQACSSAGRGCASPVRRGLLWVFRRVWPGGRVGRAPDAPGGAGAQSLLVGLDGTRAHLPDYGLPMELDGLRRPGGGFASACLGDGGLRTFFPRGRHKRYGGMGASRAPADEGARWPGALARHAHSGELAGPPARVAPRVTRGFPRSTERPAR